MTTPGFKLWRWVGKRFGWYNPWNAVPKEQAFVDKPAKIDPAILSKKERVFPEGWGCVDREK